MNRRNAFTIEVTDWSNAEFWQLLSELNNEPCLFDQPELKKDGIFWVEPCEVVAKAFKFAHCFNWLSGSALLWHNDLPVTRDNYRTLKKDSEDEYDYLPYEEITNIRPIEKEDVGTL